MSKYEVPIWEKPMLTLEEAASYFNIGVNKIRELSDERDCKFEMFSGTRRLIKRKPFEEYLTRTYSI